VRYYRYISFSKNSFGELTRERINYLEAELSRYSLKTISFAAKLRGTSPSEIRLIYNYLKALLLKIMYFTVFQIVTSIYRLYMPTQGTKFYKTKDNPLPNKYKKQLRTTLFRISCEKLKVVLIIFLTN
jgi:hypothetical protein